MNTIKKIIMNVFNYIKEHPFASFVTALSLLTTFIGMIVVYKLTGAFINLLLIFVE